MKSKKAILKIALFIVIGTGANAIKAQNFEWVKSFGGIELDYSRSITLDVYGNIYTTGYFMETVDFDPGAGTANLTSAGKYDVFIQKMDSSGNFVWAKSFGGTEDDVALDITLDAFGNIYTTGWFKGTADFDPDTGTANLSAPPGNPLYADVFVQKLNSLGNFEWAKSFGGTKEDYSCSITTDALGNVYTTGSFHGTVDFDPGPGTDSMTSTGLSDIFVHKMDGFSNFIWAKHFGETSSKSKSITIDASGNVYTSGIFAGISDFDPGPGIVNLANSLTAVFIQKMDAWGNFIWAKSLGGDFSSECSYTTLDASGNIYTTGLFWGTADFDPGVGTDSLTSAGEYDVFVQKMDASGNFVWAKSFGGSKGEKVYAITADAFGNVYTTGSFRNTVDFDPGAGINNLSSDGGSSDVFIQKMDASGNFIWAKTFGGWYNDYGSSITVDASDNVYTTGYFWIVADFDPDTSAAYLTAAGLGDVFVHKMSQSTTGVFEIEHGIQVLAYPNPSNGLVQISFKQALNNVEITVVDLKGKILLSKKLDAVSNEQINISGTAGIYFLSIKTANGQSVVKLIKE